jgi:hypothetical protein
LTAGVDVADESFYTPAALLMLLHFQELCIYEHFAVNTSEIILTYNNATALFFLTHNNAAALF